MNRSGIVAWSSMIVVVVYHAPKAIEICKHNASVCCLLFLSFSLFFFCSLFLSISLMIDFLIGMLWTFLSFSFSLSPSLLFHPTAGEIWCYIEDQFSCILSSGVTSFLLFVYTRVVQRDRHINCLWRSVHLH